MSLETNLRGRLRNTKLPTSHGLLPLFEAVVNSIHSIEDAKLPNEQGRIIISIVRNNTSQLSVLDAVLEEPNVIVGFKVTDNGLGFNETNMTSFKTLDSELKIGRGGRGVGRLLWLKAFRRVKVDSIFDDVDGIQKKRSFNFDAISGVPDSTPDNLEEAQQRLTTVYLDDFVARYRDATYKTAASIANSLLEHCLWYFVRSNGVPKITVNDNNCSVDLDDLYQNYILSSATTEKIAIKGQDFDLIHIKLRASSNRSHAIGLCAASRLVKEEKLAGKIPGLYGRLRDGDSAFFYVCYVVSPFLDDRVRAERTDFDISEKPENLFESQEIYWPDIQSAVIERAVNYLDGYLNENKRLSEERISTFVSHQAPRYRPVMPHLQAKKLVVDPSISDKELELTLHKELSNIEAKMLSDGHDLMRPQAEDRFEEYSHRLQEYLRTAEDIKKSDLANYVFHRKVILDLLTKAIKRTDDGKYVKEDLIHMLLMPMQVDSNEIKPIDFNLWLIDERLTFHDYLASDKPLISIPITGSKETKEPDIVALNVFDNPLLMSEGQGLPLASIVVVEIKRPMRNDAKEGEEKDPIEQALGYLERIREGKVSTSLGRPIPSADKIPGFCYVLCDITPSIEKRCKIHDATRTSDGLGYFFYHKSYSVYVEVISFDRLVNSARERNRAFFDKLGLPTN